MLILGLSNSNRAGLAQCQSRSVNQDIGEMVLGDFKGLNVVRPKRLDVDYKSVRAWCRQVGDFTDHAATLRRYRHNPS